MPEYLGDPSVLTKEKLKSELLANNVELPSGNPTKDVYVQLYLTKLAGQSTRAAAAAADSFSSDEELPPPALPDTSRSSGRKATRKTDKVRPTELDVTALSDKSLRDELLERGLDVGPIVEVIAAGGPEPVEEPEPAPVVERTVRSREKTVMSTRSHSSQHAAVEKIAASDQTLKVDEKDVLKELFLNDRSGPAGITATCRRPIRGAAGRPVTSSDLWSDDSLFSPKATKTSISSYTQSYSVNRVSSLPPKTTSSSLPPAGQTQAAQRSMSLWIKLFLLAIVATFLFLVYQAMETTSINPFQTSDMEVAAGSTA
ncbi:thymopoietin a isoform X2 [Astatotilapia calliptera]|uniref:thymopoietin a isoform X2 n=1 Tax=Astatotilapia calliptera TaxID=8154 RepID=UPI000E42723D|nr:thymopoietin isoform X2 [Astatotilapia calliptera]